MRHEAFYRWIVEHPVGVVMIFLAAVVFGQVSLGRLPLNLMPDLSYPSLTVRTGVPGAAPEEVETQVSRPLEENLATIQGLVELESRSRAEMSDLVLEFDWGTDMDRAAQDVRERLQITMLPDEAERPLILRYDPNLDPILRVSLSTPESAGTSPDALVRRLLQLRDLADREIKPALEALEGVAAVRVSGGYEREILIEPKELLLRSRGLALSDLSRALIAQNVNVSGGSIRDGDTEYLIRTLNQFKSVEEVRELDIARADGLRVRIGDVATVREAWRDREVANHLDGKEAVELEIYREADANIVAVSRGVLKRLGLDEASQKKARMLKEKAATLPPGVAEKLKGPPTLADALPKDVTMGVADNQASFVESAIANIQGAALQGGLLAILVLFLFLRSFRATFIIGVSIPVSIICSFACMALTDVSLNLMSLGGLALGVGMLVDASVVVLESIQNHIDAGEDRKTSAIRGAGEVAIAVAASVATTVVVFLPIVFVEGIAGQLFRDLALVVCFSLLASMAVALLLVPVLAAWSFHPGPAPDFAVLAPSIALPSLGDFVRGWRAQRGWRRVTRPYLILRFVLRLLAEILAAAALLVGALLGRAGVFLSRHIIGRPASLALKIANSFGAWYTRRAAGYDTILGKALSRPGLVMGLATLALLSALALVPSLGAELIPNLHHGRFTVEAELPVGTPLDRSLKVMTRAEELLLSIPGVEHVHARIGAEKRAETRSDEGEHTARLLVELSSGGDLAEREEQVQYQARALLSGLPGLKWRASTPALFSFRTPIEVILSGHDLGLLRSLSTQTLADLRDLPVLKDLKSSLNQGYPEVRIHYDRRTLARFGLDPATVAQSVRDRVLGADARELARGEKRIDMLVRLDPQDRASVAQIKNLNVNPKVHPPIPLESVATLEEGEGPSEIRRINQRRVAVLSAGLDGFDLAGASSQIQEMLEQRDWPDDYSFRLAGQSQEMQASLRSLWFVMALATFLVYAIMAASFESFLQPFLILGTIPLAVVGVMVTLAVVGTPLSVVVLIGIITLVGVVVNNAIVLVDAVNWRWRELGEPRSLALRSAAKQRLRPILVTTATTVLGLVPLALGFGEGAELQRPMAITVIAGLSSSTLLTLIVIPVLYDRVMGWTAQGKKAS